MKKLAFGVALVGLVVLGCRTAAPPPSESTPPRDIQPETMTDPGLDPRGSGQGGMEDRLAAELRTIYFAFDDYSLTDESKDALRVNATLLRQNPDARLEIQGNCDERGTNEYNLALGQRRADAAKRYLMDLGVNGDRLSTISFGEENPAVAGSNEAAWAKNRRDEFKLR